MTFRHAIWLGPLVGPLASSWGPLYPPARGGFGGVTPMTLCPPLFSSSSPLQTVPTSSSRLRHVITDRSSLCVDRGRGDDS
jgi:hypothetical protein